MNGIHKRSEIFDFHLFADDTNILYDDKSLKSLKNFVNNNKLKYIIDWLKVVLRPKKKFVFPLDFKTMLTKH